ncbi:regulator of G-protein signaling 9-binding protein-like [Apteryx mantelli]|uniref:Regulator of G-protein signaling 9-binding protein-like n=1 Tax=Apteryx mantelli TaxID=2696672 RepID=A0ABM4FFJ7_9AVES
MAAARAGACSAAGARMAALSAATAGHRQLVLQLGGSADCAQLREELRRSSARVCELSTGLRSMLVEGLRRPPASPEEHLELERLWVLFLSALELFLQDLRKAQHLRQLFAVQGPGVAPLCTGLGGRREWGRPGRRGSRRGPEQPPAAPHPEEEIEQVRAMLAEMESRANIPPWTVEAAQQGRTGGSVAAGAGAAWGQRHAARPRPGAGLCCQVL